MRIASLIALTLFFTLPACTGKSLIHKDAKLESAVTGLGMPDGPAWDGQVLWFPDVKKQQLSKYDPATGKTEVVIDNAGLISATEMDHKNRLVLSEHVLHKLTRFVDGKTELIFQHADHKPDRNPNDLTIDAHGGIYHTLTSTDEVWYNSADGSKSLAVASVPKPNGICLSPNNKTLYVSAFIAKQIHAFEVKRDGTLGPGRVLATLGDDIKDLGADGMTVDKRGNIYVTMPTAVWVVSPKGKILTKIEVPKKPINCEFGGADGKTLYITAGDTIYSLQMNVKGGR